MQKALIISAVLLVAAFLSGYFIPSNYHTVTQTETVTSYIYTHTSTIATETVTKIANVSIELYSQDPDLRLRVKEKRDVFGFIDSIVVYVTNEGNETKSAMLVVLSGASFGKVIGIDELEPGVTLRYEVKLSPAATHYYITVLTPKP